VVSAETVVNREWLTRIESSDIGIHGPLPVIGVDALCPTVSHQHFLGLTGKLYATLIRIVATVVEAGRPNHHRSRVGYKAEALFAFTHRTFSASALDQIRSPRSLGCARSNVGAQLTDISFHQRTTRRSYAQPVLPHDPWIHPSFLNQCGVDTRRS